MRKFAFSLAAALALRERIVEAEKVRLRAVQQEWNAQLARQQTLAAEVRSAESEVWEAGKQLQAADLMALDRYRAAAQRKRLRLVQEANEISKRLAERQTALRSVERDLTLLIRLKEKAKSRWQHEYDKEQQQLAEEAYLSRWNAR